MTSSFEYYLMNYMIAIKEMTILLAQYYWNYGYYIFLVDFLSFDQTIVALILIIYSPINLNRHRDLHQKEKDYL